MSTPRTNSTRVWEKFAIHSQTLDDLREDLVEDGEDMSYCMHSSDFLEAFFPLPSPTEDKPEPLERKPKPLGIDFDGVVGFTSERDLAERWVSG